jgi:molybdopterin-containing oxidoreductase family membrane subunit
MKKRFNFALKFSKLELLLAGIFAIFLAISVAIGVKGLFQGHEHLYGTTRELPIALLLGAYIFFVVTSTGLCIISAIGHVFHFDAFAPIAKRAVFLSIATIMGGFVCLMFELDSPWKMHYFILTPNFKSGIWWMACLYSFYLAFMISEFIALIFNNHKLGSLLGFLGLSFGLAAHSNMGAVFGTLQGRPFWTGAFMPIYFIVSAFFSGTAAIIFFTYLSKHVKQRPFDERLNMSFHKLGWLFLFAIFIMMFFDTWSHIIGTLAYAGGKTLAIDSFEGPLKVNYWFFEITCGLLIPFIFILLTRAKSQLVLFICSAISICGIFYMRYDLMLAGQIVPLWHEIGASCAKYYVKYAPTVPEMLVFCGGLAFVGLAYIFGEKILDLDEDQSH